MQFVPVKTRGVTPYLPPYKGGLLPRPCLFSLREGITMPDTAGIKKNQSIRDSFTDESARVTVFAKRIRPGFFCHIPDAWGASRGEIVVPPNALIPGITGPQKNVLRGRC